MHGDGFQSETLLHMAAGKGFVETVRLLIAKGASIDIQDRTQFFRGTSLLAAASAAHVPTLEVLLDAGADINFRCYNGATALNLVLARKMHVQDTHVETIQFLLDRGLHVK